VDEIENGNEYQQTRNGSSLLEDGTKMVGDHVDRIEGRTRGWGGHCCNVAVDERMNSGSNWRKGRGRGWKVGVVEWGGRIVEVVVDAAGVVAGVVADAGADRKSGTRRCRRC
jgi:hypothetical protein